LRLWFIHHKINHFQLKNEYCLSVHIPLLL
jgi:hypothetical protein